MKERVLEIVVQALEGESAEEVARRCVSRLALGDGVRVAVVSQGATGRCRRFVAQAGGITSPRQYSVVQLATALDAILHRDNRPLDAWDLLVAARAYDAAIAHVTLATVRSATRLLMRQGRARAGRSPGTWLTARPDRAVA
ncbi:MAG: hypothetical protein NVSMB65_08140 [Chloroflexota bacterium]